MLFHHGDLAYTVRVDDVEAVIEQDDRREPGEHSDNAGHRR